MSRYGRGARPSSRAKLAAAFPASSHQLIRRALLAPLPAAASLAQYEPTRLDQGSTSACTAHALAAAVYTAAHGGLTWVPSPDLEYKATRALERAILAASGATLPDLTDSGAELADAIHAMGEYGVAPMGPQVEGRNSDVEASTVNDEIVVGRLEKSDTMIVTGEYRASGTGQSLYNQLCASIVSGFPVYVGAFVDTAFENLAVGQIAGAPDQSDPNGGGHAIFLDGYFTQPDGSRVWRLVNSWGPDWCDGGTCLVGQAWVSACFETWVVDVNISQGAVS
jgi:hypothetical protein